MRRQPISRDIVISGPARVMIHVKNFCSASIVCRHIQCLARSVEVKRHSVFTTHYGKPFSRDACISVNIGGSSV